MHDKDEIANWRRLVEQGIGTSLEALASQTDDGLTIEPLYARVDHNPPQPWRRSGAWAVSTRIDHPNAEDANRLARLDLDGGADALVLVDPASRFARGFGGELAAGKLDVILETIDLGLIGLRLDAGRGTPAGLTALAEIVKRRTLTSAAVPVDIGYDPIGWRAQSGQPVENETGRLLELREGAGLGGTLFLADGRPWHEAGAGEAQELAAVLATAVAYLRRLEALGVRLDQGRGAIGLLLAADADILLGLAKFRAIRRLWARIESSSGPAPKPVRLHAETSWRMMTRYDPWTNVMRTTAAAFAAGLGGVDALAVLPFTMVLGLPDGSARRLARNLQHVLLDEAHLARVDDPSAGSGAIEGLTDDLCREAWRQFQDIEREGGIERSIDVGTIQKRIAVTAATRQRNFAHLQRGIVGTSRFASLAAAPKAILDIAPRSAPKAAPTALPSQRDAAAFEALRDLAEARAASDERPRIFLATLGSPQSFAARAVAATNFFASAGLAVEQPDQDAPEDVIAAFGSSSAKVVCLCGTDEAYRSEAASLTGVMRAAGARWVALMGTDDGTTGCDAFVHDGCDALRALTAALDAALNEGDMPPADSRYIGAPRT